VPGAATIRRAGIVVRLRRRVGRVDSRDWEGQVGKDLRDGVQWLKAVVAVLLAALALVAYLYLDEPGQEDGLRGLALDLLPEVILVLILAPIGYYVLQRRGLGKGMDPPSDEDWSPGKLKQEIVDAVAELPAYANPLATSAPEVRRFWPSHRKVAWEDVIGNAESLDIVVVYYEQWIDDNRDELLSVFQRGGSVRLYMTDPEDVAAIEATAARFPEHDVERLREKIRGTARKFEALRRQADSYNAHLDIWLFPGVLNYAAVRADDDYVLLSVYEHKRERRIDSPAVLLDIKQSPTLKRFWDKELRCLTRESRRPDELFSEPEEEAA